MRPIASQPAFLHFWWFLLFLPPPRLWKTSSTPVPAAAWPPTCWGSATGTTTTSCSRPLATCSTSTSAGSWATRRCLATSRGEKCLRHLLPPRLGPPLRGCGSSASGFTLASWSEISRWWVTPQTLSSPVPLSPVQGPGTVRLHFGHGVRHQRRGQALQPLPRLRRPVLPGLQPDPQAHPPLPQPAGAGESREGTHPPTLGTAEGSSCLHPPSPPALPPRCCPVASLSSPTWRTSSMSMMP